MLKTFVILCALAAVSLAELKSGSIRIPEIIPGEFNVPLDHFRPQDNRTAHFTYEYDIDYYAIGGPTFFYINDAGMYTNEWITHGVMYDVARELGGALFTTDLRYFRLNLPTPSATLEDLSYLTVEQILADIVTFITVARVHLEVPPFSRVIVWGTGFGGTLAALARQKFPYLIHAAWTTGGVFEPTVFTTENYDILSSNIYQYGTDECGVRVREAFAEIDRQLLTHDDETLVEEFSICRPWNINEHMDVGLFSEGLIQQISDFFDAQHAFGVSSFCNAMSAIPNDPFRSLARWVRFVYNADFGRCFNYDYVGRRRWLNDPQWYNPGTASGLRQFTYLQCSQIGQLRITTQGGMFGNHITERYRYEMCEDAFGEEFDFDRLFLSVNELRTVYGGRNPGVSRLFITNGLLDTWFSHGILAYYEPDSHVINLPGYGRSADLASVNIRDSTVMYNAKQEIMRVFREWGRP